MNQDISYGLSHTEFEFWLLAAENPLIHAEKSKTEAWLKKQKQKHHHQCQKGEYCSWTSIPSTKMQGRLYWLKPCMLLREGATQYETV